MDQYQSNPILVTGSVGLANASITVTGSLPVVIENAAVPITATGSLPVSIVAAGQLLSSPCLSGSVYAFSVASGSSAQSSFGTSTYFGLRANISASSVFTLKAEGDTWYRFATTNSGEVVDENEVTGSNQCGIIFAGEREDIVLPVGTQSIVTKGAAACKIRLWKSG